MQVDLKHRIFYKLLDDLEKFTKDVEKKYIQCEFFDKTIKEYNTLRTKISCKYDIPFALCILEFYKNLLICKYFIPTELDKETIQEGKKLIDRLDYLIGYYDEVQRKGSVKDDHRPTFICLFMQLNNEISEHFSVSPSYVNPFISKEYVSAVHDMKLRPCDTDEH